MERTEGILASQAYVNGVGAESDEPVRITGGGFYVNGVGAEVCKSEDENVNDSNKR